MSQPTETAVAAAAAAASAETPAAGTPAAPAAAAATPKTDGQAAPGAGAATGNENKTPEQIAADKVAADKAAAEKAAAAAPAKYELTLPEGGRLDQSDLDEFVAMAKDKGLTSEQAQAVLTEHAQALAAQADRFLTETKSHPEIGGAHLEAAQKLANAALERFLPATAPEGQAFRSFLTKTGYGNSPAVVLLLSRIGKAMAEDQPIAAGAGARSQRRSHAEVLFGDAK